MCVKESYKCNLKQLIWTDIEIDYYKLCLCIFLEVVIYIRFSASRLKIVYIFCNFAGNLFSNSHNLEVL